MFEATSLSFLNIDLPLQPKLWKHVLEYRKLLWLGIPLDGAEGLRLPTALQFLAGGLPFPSTCVQAGIRSGSDGRARL